MRLNLGENSVDAICQMVVEREEHTIYPPMEREFKQSREIEVTVPSFAKPDEQMEKMRKKLPVCDYQPIILDGINKNQIIVICGETGIHSNKLN